MRIAYVVSRFPKVSETFITREIQVLEELREQVDVYALIREQEGVVHPEAAPLAARAVYGTGLFAEIVTAQLQWLLRRPLVYLATWVAALRMNVRSPRFFARALLTVPVAATFARRMAADEVEHVHAHWATHPALAAYVIHRLVDLPYSVTVHAHDLYEDVTGLAEKLRAASHVVTISDFNHRLLLELVPDLGDRLLVIRCGADLDLFDAARGAATRPTGPPRIVCIGSLEDYKGQHHLITACHELVRRGVAFRCRLIGEGPERAALERRIENTGLQASVSLLGRLPSDAVRRELAAATVFVLPSVVTSTGKMEGIPVALMEAMAAGVPVVASAISGIPELVEDGVTGSLVPPGQPSAIADAVARLFVDEELVRRLTGAAADRVRSQYDLRTNVAEMRRQVLTVGPDAGSPRDQVL